MLRLGSSGDAVRRLQRELNRVGPSLIVDGEFGPRTLEAVRRFQLATGLAADGVVGKLTWAALMEKTPPSPPTPDASDRPRAEEWMAPAYVDLGVREVPGPGDDPKVVAYLASTKVPASMLHDSTAWCGGFVSFKLIEAGMESIRSAWAADWMRYGDPSEAVYGAVAARMGHVGFVVEKQPGRVKLLGGNQGDAVSEAWFDDAGWAYRWPRRASSTPPQPAEPPSSLPPSRSYGYRKVCPNGPVLKGIDVSIYQGSIDWPHVAAAGCKFAFIKATEGVSLQDPRFSFNWPRSKAAGVIRGAYHFFRPKIDPVAQARFFANVVGQLDEGDLPPALDLEVLDGVDKPTVLARGLAFLAEIERLTGRVPILYSGSWFLEDLNPDASIARYPLWVAHYTNGCPLTPSDYADWTFWQYSGSGSHPGIDGAVDLNEFDGSLDDLKNVVARSKAARA